MNDQLTKIPLQCPRCAAQFILQLQSGITHIVAAWSEKTLVTKEGGPVATVVQETLLVNIPADGKRLTLSAPIVLNKHFVGEREHPTRWSLSKISEGVWTLDPSIVVKGAVHAFVTITDVPPDALTTDG